MKKIIYSILLLSFLCVCVNAEAQNRMTDKQVLEYVEKGLSAGKSQKDMMQELALRGVDRAQFARVKKMYENGGAEDKTSSSSNSASRKHTQKDEKVLNNKVAKSNKSSNATTSKSRTARQAIARRAIVGDEYDEEEDYLFEEEEEDESNKKDSIEVFGRNIFNQDNLNFRPSETMPTPRNYVLGPGDEVIVDVFGANQTTIRNEISPEGYINVEVLGPIFLTGKTIEAANAYLKNKLAAIYDGLNDSESITEIQLSLGQIRTIQISVLGEVWNPGTYSVSSLGTVFNAMTQAGGIKEPGTVRSIKVVRNSKIVATFDVYDLLINGSRKGDVRLNDGDVLLVEPYDAIVKASGLVKRPIYFEMKDGETVAELLRYAGGFASGAYKENISVSRQTEQDSVIFVVEAAQFNEFKLQNGDEIIVKKLETRFKNRIFAAGSVYLPGVYELNNEVNSVRKLINKAGGLMPEAFSQRALIHRQNDDRSLETFAVDLKGVIEGTVADVPLQNNDSIYVNSIYELSDYGTMSIDGEVAAPGIFPFSENTTVQDLILMAGGLLRSASIVRVDVSRKIFDNESLVAQSEIARYYTFTMQNGFAVDGADRFVLEPYDVVTVRRSPSYVDSRIVSIEGEVNFPGTYNMSKRQERITDLLAKAGDVTDFAYVKGARLTRLMNESELAQYESLSKIIRAEGDSAQNAVPVSSYLVAFDMTKAIQNPGSEYDIVLREGDVLNVPVYNNTVRIDGAVQMPTTISFRKGLNKRILVNEAGGYAKRAYKQKAFVVFMNGRVSKLNRFTKIEPGCQVFVPKKAKKEGEVQKVLSISSTAASLGLTAASIANLMK